MAIKHNKLKCGHVQELEFNNSNGLRMSVVLAEVGEYYLGEAEEIQKIEVIDGVMTVPNGTDDFEKGDEILFRVGTPIKFICKTPVAYARYYVG